MKKKIEIIGIVQVKANYDRVKKKNLRKFGNTNLFELKLSQLKKTKNFKHIVVSSENKKILDVAKKNGFETHLGDPYYSTSSVPMSEVYSYLGSSIEGEHIAWINVTNPLAESKIYDKAVELYKKKEFNKKGFMCWKKPFFYILDNITAKDIDNKEDLCFAKWFAKKFMIKNYKNNKNDSPSKIVIKLTKRIENYVSQNLYLKKLIIKINTFHKIPKKNLNQKICQIIFNDFNFKKNKFENYKIFFLLRDFFKYYFIIFINIFFHRKCLKKKKNYKLLCDTIYAQNDINRHSKLIKIFKSVCFLSNLNNKKKISSESYFKFRVINLGISDQSLKKKFFFLFLGFTILNFSLVNKVNYFRIFYLLVFDILRSKHIFSLIKADYFFSYRFYTTSPIFNYYFKKNGGLKTSCFQKNILAYSLSAFVFTDIFFTLGKKQGEICNKIGGKIKKIIPVGSIEMENLWFNNKKNSNLFPKSNVLILGINTLYNDRHYINYQYENSYYNLFLNWINQLTFDFPELNFIIKHHNSYEEDPREISKLFSTNLKIISNDNKNSSYDYAHNTELIISFASTMVLELLGNDKKAFFVDPGLTGNQWFDSIKNLKRFRISNYKNLKKLVHNRKKNFKVNRSLADNFCLKSKKTSMSIAKNLLNKKK